MAANLKNPLHNYNQYTYHFILMLSRDESCLDEFMDVNDIDIFNHPTVEQGGKYQPKPLKSGGEYVVLFNSMTDAEFYINRVEMDTWLRSSPIDSKQDFSAQTTQLSISLDIIEYLTLDFIPVIQHCAKQLNTSIQDAVVIFKIIFSGIPDPTQQGVEPHILNTPAFACSINALTMTINETGARYALVMYPNANSKSLLEHYSTVGRQQFSVKSNKLKDIFNELNNKLKHLKIDNEKRLTDGNKIVNYIIDIDDEYSNYTYGANSVKSNTHIVDGEEPLIISSNSDKITGIVQDILMSSPEILEDNVIKQQDGTNIKYTPQVDVSMQHDSKNNEYIYYVKIIRTKEIISTPENSENIIEYYKQENAFLEYDFIYTGKNVDILKMDVEVPISLAYLYSSMSFTPTNQTTPTDILKTGPNTYATSKAKETGDVLTATNQDMKINTHDTNRLNTDGKKPIIPLIPQSSPYSANIPTSENNQSLYAASRRSLTEHLNQTIVKNEIDIVGDPQILFGILFKQMNVVTSKTVAEYKTKMISNNNTKELLMVSPNIMTGLVKINLRAPKPKFDNINNRPTDSPKDPTDFENKFSTSFWYQGLYIINQIRSVFESGKFIQTLYMTAQPYSNTGHNIAPYKTGTIEPNNASSITDTTSTSTIKSKNSKSTNAYTRSPEFQQKLHDLEKKHDLPEGYLNTMMMIESSGDPNKVNPVSGAQGLYQFIPSTAKQYGVNPFNPDSAAEGAARYITALRRDYGFSLEEATAAYNTGPGNMRRILRGNMRMPSETSQYIQKFKSRGQTLG